MKGKRTYLISGAVMAFMMTLAVVLFNPVQAQADITTSNFAVSYLNLDQGRVSFDLANYPVGNYSAYYDVELYDANLNLLGSDLDGNITYATINAPLKKNKIYYYRVRPYVRTYDTSTRAYVKNYLQGWTDYKVFDTIQVKVKLVSKKGKDVRFKAPKVGGVKSVQLYMSTSKSGGYKKKR